MFNLMHQIIQYIRDLFVSKPVEIPPVSPAMRKTLERDVSFYKALSPEDKLVFEQRAALFLSTTEIVGAQVDIDESDLILVAASAVIPVWGFKGWHYFNLKMVVLYPHSFNEDLEFKQPDSNITGMVGTGMMHGKMLLSKPALHLGFKNTRDKQNVGIHEFVHLIDMADGDCDGFPERLKSHAYSIPWFELVDQKIQDIDDRESNIRDYGATNRAEFFSVASEYFFERPKMLKQKHPELYQSLEAFYQQNMAEMQVDLNIKKKQKCPCGSGKRYKRCCMPKIN